MLALCLSSQKHLSSSFPLSQDSSPFTQLGLVTYVNTTLRLLHFKDSSPGADIMQEE